MIRVRFAPSPTGSFHIGGARTALYNVLFVENMKRQGKDAEFFLRIEDTDQERYKPHAVSELIQTLDWLGYKWEAGPTAEELLKFEVDRLLVRKYGKPWTGQSYVQSERKDIYGNLAKELLERKLAYPVFTDARIDKADGKRGWAKLSETAQVGQFREASPFMIQSAIATGRQYFLMLKLPRGGSATVTDYLRGDIKIPWKRQHDLVILKPDGMPTYHFASVVDDHQMGVTHVIRGAEWLDSLPVHFYLYRIFEWDRPEFVHLPLILNPSGKGKMSKRNGQDIKDGHGRVVPTFTVDYMRAGFIPSALNNFLALTGWNPKDGGEIMSWDELIEKFSLENINTTAAAWNYGKLLSFNQQHIKRMPESEFAEIAERFI
jgi:glutamyl-tRNA synthetase